MAKYEWTTYDQDDPYPEKQVWHIVGDEDKTLCGLSTATAYGRLPELGVHRSCDNCTEILARHAEKPVEPESANAESVNDAVIAERDDKA
jgi:hypothetical protein